MGDSTDARVVVLNAPAGYGKTTVLAQWVAEDIRPFGWLTVTEAHNDPALLQRDIDAVFAFSSRPAVGALQIVPESASWDFGWPTGGSCVLVVDDAHLLTADSARWVVDRLVRSVPAGSQIALASRDGNCWGPARLAAQQQVVTLTQADLAFSPDEERRMFLAVAGGSLTSTGAEYAGWPAAVGLGCRAASASDDAAVVASVTLESLLEYVESEVLFTTTPADLASLARFSILSELTGPGCAALVGPSGPAVLHRAVRGGLLPMIPTVLAGGTELGYRFHPLVRQALMTMLRRDEPRLIAELHQQAGAWYAAAGDIDAAIRHAVQSGDMERVGALVWANVHPGLSNEALRQLQGWLDGLTAEDIGRSLRLMVSAAWSGLLSGNFTEVLRWQVLAESRRAACPPMGVIDKAEIDVALLLLRNWRDPGMNGMLPAPSGMEWLDALPAGSRWRPAAGFWAGMALALDGDTRQSMKGLRATEELARVMDHYAVQADCVAALALMSYDMPYDSDCTDESLALATTAEKLLADNHLQDRATSLFVWSVVGLTSARTGWYVRAAATLSRVRGMITATADLAPWLTVQITVLQARTFLLLGDVAQARQLTRRARCVVDGHSEGSVPDAGLAGMETLLGQLSTGLTYGFKPMTAAEHRVLSLLPSCLSFTEMAELMFLSRHTVKAHAMSIYRKLGASSRYQVVERACSLGYLSPSALPRSPATDALIGSAQGSDPVGPRFSGWVPPVSGRAT